MFSTARQGKPVHPIEEMPVSTETTRPNEQPWPPQPIPFTAAGQPMKPVSPVFPIDVPAELSFANTRRVVLSVRIAGVSDASVDRAGPRRVQADRS